MLHHSFGSSNITRSWKTSQIMTIKYTDGRTMEAVILSRDDNAIRAAVIGGDDAAGIAQVGCEREIEFVA